MSGKIPRSSLDQMIGLFKILQEESTLRNGLWLESNGYDIEYLTGYDEEVYVFGLGASSNLGLVAQRLGVSYSRVCTLMSAMRTCGSIHRLNRGVHVLLEEPNEETLSEVRRRSTVPLNSTKQAIGLREYVHDQMITMHKRVDELRILVEELSRKVEDKKH